jgi:peptidoglycan/LPS O-acetylase OafA/YrhL
LFVRYPDLLLGRLLNWRPLAFLGTLSYSLYLLHHIVIYVFQTHLPGRALLSSSLAFVVSLLLAVVIWRTIERPLGSLRKSLNAPARAG